jgi:fructose-1,6-bisphosphatase/inositol monophosphatase family enzyme
LPVWGTLVGLKVDGHARSGFMSQPFTGEMFVADGTQSVLMRGTEPAETLSTRKAASLDDAILFTTTPTLYEGPGREAYDRLEARVRLARYGCDCYAFAMLAAGFADIVVEPGLQTYDIAALIPLIEQAGGVVTTWAGKNAVDGGDVIAAATPELHAAAIEILNA